MAWLFLFVGVSAGIFCLLTSFAVTGLTVICGLSFVAAAVYEVASVLRQLTEALTASSHQSTVLPKKLKQAPLVEEL